MKTFVFIGSDKDAGKTTVLNFIYRRLKASSPSKGPICLTATGVSGKKHDAFSEILKPSIPISEKTLFITHSRHLSRLNGAYKIIQTFPRPKFADHYVLGRALKACRMILEGPNTKKEILKLKGYLEQIMPNGFLLIDGSTDRLFLGHPAVCDAFYFAVMISNHTGQRQKALNLLTPLNFPHCSATLKTQINQNADTATKSLLFEAGSGSQYHVIYHGKEIPATDNQLRYRCRQPHKSDLFLYLNGALTGGLYDFLKAINGLSLILDNFTLYQSFSPTTAKVMISDANPFALKISLLHRIKVNMIFVKTENRQTSLNVPENIPIANLYRDDPYEIGIRTGRSF